MRLALYGATGTIGQRILKEALLRGHEVTAIVRDPSKIKEDLRSIAPTRLHVIAGNILDVENVRHTVTGQDAVISAFGPQAMTLDTLPKSGRSLITGIKQAYGKRLVVVGGAGSLEVSPGVQLVDTPQFPATWKDVALAHRDLLNILREKGREIDWTYFSPAASIEPGKRTGEFRLGTNQLVTDSEGKSRISTEDYALALMNEVEIPHHIQQQFTIGY